MSNYSSSLNFHNTQGLAFFQDELESKDAQILLWQKRYEDARNEGKQIKIELSAAKAYIETLPTKQEVVHLKNRVSSLEEEKAQLFCDLKKLKNKNIKTVNSLIELKKDMETIQGKLESQTLESETLKSIIKLWETRRKAAKESGKLTVEDALVEKLKVQDQFDELIKVATCREQHLMAKIESMKMKVEDSRRAEKEAKENGLLLLEEVDSLQKRIEERGQEIVDLLKKRNESEIIAKELEERVLRLEAKEKRTLSIIRKLEYCFHSIATCKKATEGIILFIQSALDGKFVDPTLIFVEDGLSHLEFNQNKEILADDEGFEKLAVKCIDEVNNLKEEVEFCRKSLTDKYVSQLSDEVSNNCHIQ